MENQNTQFSPKIKNYLTMTAHWAMITAVVIALRLCFTIYYIFTYIYSLSIDNNLHSYTYIGNNLMDIILSVLSVYFLYRFAQQAYRVCRSKDSLSLEGVFANFRNYLIISIVLSLNWMFFSAMNLLRGGIL